MVILGFRSLARNIKQEREESITIWLFSDSLGWQAKDEFQRVVELSGHKFGYVGFPGTAICDWMNQTVTSVKKGDIAVLQFSGNSFTSCMLDPNDPGQHYTGNGLLDKYAQDSVKATENLLHRARASHVIWQASPITQSATTAVVNSRQISALYMTLPHLFPTRVSYNDAGLSVVYWPSHVYTPTLPCMQSEVPVHCLSVKDSIQVRASDGVHFCPKVSRDGLHCDEYCSGCVRFGASMALSALKTIAGGELSL